ncbi:MULTISPECIES: outer membrane protein assembly factor BamE [Thalassolituus]|jgi:outer membrane protein assembly factor BamE|uniref:outer membrane protein assembly factor BamE n=1 Tax=Thalassolituus TaxID=187492 RepID=UPI0007CF6377|nr:MULTISPECIES: outer membrane protein assembly factor BamE [Thalassolituus]KZY95521.1 cell envelope protein SmpA [Oleibacter sp. HI0075]MAX85517.1 outer membrane protein assembly factor BamE [Oceanospirillaceae bacterium]MEE3210078.1 outer membrane protein assembly factor BamE [Pseudomonadota bacterium]HCG77966.1 outer membrane protein assembly factor BamE [Oceanospirillales bacterium]KZZ11659.1 cell envelope protein SmpA [Oleibacter sp. HI0075]|tara:strand:- start:7025 stop:7423 length:399 start_codon:yes stop_codon:yes gene_type:complete
MRALILTGLLGFATLSGCTFPGVYKLNVQQGNIVTQDMLDQLEPGMTERQVIYLMGNPVARNPFSDQRWNYIYTLEVRDKIAKRYQVTLHFDDAALYSHYSGEIPPEEFSEENQTSEVPPEERNPTIPTVEE